MNQYQPTACMARNLGFGLVITTITATIIHVAVNAFLECGIAIANIFMNQKRARKLTVEILFNGGKMIKVNTHGLKMTGLKKTSGGTENYSYYSGKYDEIFYTDNGKYIMFAEQDVITNAKHNSVKAKISS